MSNRTTTLKGWIWAKDAPNLPSTPAANVTYKDTGLEQSDVEKAWPYSEPVDSATFNELMNRITSLLSLLEQGSFLPYCSTLSYTVPAIVIGSDNNIYTSLQNSLGHDPVSSPTYWSKWLGYAAAIPDASNSVKGKVKLSTNSEAVDETNTTTAVPPSALALIIDSILGALDLKSPLDNPTFSTQVACNGQITANNAALKSNGYEGVSTNGLLILGNGYINKFGSTFSLYNPEIGNVIINKAGTIAMLDDISGLLPKVSFTDNDFIRIPDKAGGLIIQWGIITALSTDGTSASISFPTTFPNAVYGIFSSHVSSGVDGNPVSSCSVKNDYTTSAFKLMQDTAKGNGVNEFWFAVGR